MVSNNTGKQSPTYAYAYACSWPGPYVRTDATELTFADNDGRDEGQLPGRAVNSRSRPVPVTGHGRLDGSSMPVAILGATGRPTTRRRGRRAGQQGVDQRMARAGKGIDGPSPFDDQVAPCRRDEQGQAQVGQA